MKKSMIIAALLSAGVAFSQTLNVSPEKLDVLGTALTGVSTASIEVYNIGTGTSYYTISIPTTATNWLSVSPSSGNSTNEIDAIVFTFTATGLADGFYETDVTITQTNAPVTVKTLPVRMKIDKDENLGVAVGPSSMATAATGVAIGSRDGRAVAVGASTIQIGAGVNSSAGTVAIGKYQILTSGGLIPAARLAAVAMDGSAITGVRASQLTGLYQADTNATTTTTGYTPTFVGQLLTGSAGTGTNAIWISKGVTSNDWVQVAP